jgi:hypothetical protein
MIGAEVLMTVRRNKAGREIWFERVAWTGFPCHWKGWALIAGVPAAANASVWLLVGLSGALNKPDVDWPFLILLPFVVFGVVLAERHTS